MEAFTEYRKNTHLSYGEVLHEAHLKLGISKRKLGWVCSRSPNWIKETMAGRRYPPPDERAILAVALNLDFATLERLLPESLQCPIERDSLEIYGLTPLELYEPLKEEKKWLLEKMDKLRQAYNEFMEKKGRHIIAKRMEAAELATRLPGTNDTLLMGAPPPIPKPLRPGKQIPKLKLDKSQLSKMQNTLDVIRRA